jgi:hypothetical protein
MKTRKPEKQHWHDTIPEDADVMYGAVDLKFRLVFWQPQSLTIIWVDLGSEIGFKKVFSI